ncbi:MAG: hypothetical protein IPL33_16780 [Sphingobacteriales bacterium]|nr:hypothetical protein [Sphingobacteriales bacterium]
MGCSETFSVHVGTAVSTDQMATAEPHCQFGNIGLDITEINGAQIYYYYASNVNDANGNPLPFVFNGSTQNTVTLSENYEVFVVGSMGCQTFVGRHSCTCEGLDIDVSV